MDDAALWSAYAWPDECLRVNFVISLDGHIGAPDGLSGGLSSPEDRRVFHMLRAGCDAILVGAGTARTEGYRAPAVKLEWQQFRQRSKAPVLVMVSASGSVPDIEGAVTVDGTDLAAVIAQYPRLLCEGGPHLFASLLEQRLVDEVALSISGQVGGTGRLLPDEVRASFTPRHAHTADNTIFTLWRRS